MAKNKTLTLYQRENCPYCQIVRKKIEQLGLQVLIVPVEQNGEERLQLKEVSGQQSVPVLVDGDQVFIESNDILSHLDQKYGNGKDNKISANDYGLRTKVKGDFEAVMELTIEALNKQGFGVLTDIDVKKTLKNKINVDVPKQVILGACNPHLAHQAMDAENDLGLLLPCNVVIREADEESFWVTAVNPIKLLSVVGRDDLLPIADDVKAKMSRVIETVTQRSTTIPN